MLVFRGLLILLLLMAVLSFALYLGTGRAHYKRLSFITLKWSVIAGLTFFAVLLLGRML